LEVNELTIIVNTGDDFNYLGLNISPDLDTVCYTLAGISNNATGWGIEGDTFQILEKIRQFHGPDWFRIGDTDLSINLCRSQLLSHGLTLTEATKMICKSLKVSHLVLPMTNGNVRTIIKTTEKGWLDFQEYFVKFRHDLIIEKIKFQGIEKAQPTDEVLNSLRQCDVVVICPSNPFLSIDPITQLKGVKEVINQKLVIAVSPLIHGKAIKGPLEKIFRDLNLESSNLQIAEHYGKFLNCLIVDEQDSAESNNIKTNTSSYFIESANIYLPDLESRINLATKTISIAQKMLSSMKSI
jgi:LPPG:FO 2-phospho-L-lactate transferase